MLVALPRYWSVTTMSTIGYGDIFPVTAPERILGMMLMVMGCAFFAWITGKITQLMTQKLPSEDRFDASMEEVDIFMNIRRMPALLQTKIHDYYKVKYPNKSIFDEYMLIDQIDSPILKKGIVSHLYKDVVEGVEGELRLPLMSAVNVSCHDVPTLAKELATKAAQPLPPPVLSPTVLSPPAFSPLLGPRLL